MEQIFISYRSPKYEDLKKNKCRVVLGQKCDGNLALSCKFENCSYRKAIIFANSYSQYKSVVIPPTYILDPKDLLRVFDFMSYTPQLYYSIMNSDYFIRFDIENDSYWTKMELDFWKMKCLKKSWSKYLVASSCSDGNFNLSEESFTPLTKNDYELYWRMVYYIQPEHKFDHAWGKYANCFLQRCPNCGNHWLLSIKAIKYLSDNRLAYSCPFCHGGNFSYTYDKSLHPVEFNYSGKENIYKVLEPKFIRDLLLDCNSKAPKNSIPLICMSKEKFHDGIAILVYLELLDSLYKVFSGYGELEIRQYNAETKKVSRFSFH